MRVQFIGNAQFAKLQAMFRRSVPECVSAHSLIANGQAGPDSDQIRRAAQAEIVVIQATASPRSAALIRSMRENLASEIVALPLIAIDGIASLEQETFGDRTVIWGADALLEAARKRDRATLLRDFLAGEIDMRQESRLEASLGWLRSVEAEQCDVTISDVIADLLHERPLVYGMRAPTQFLLYRLFERLCNYVGVDPDPTMPWDPVFDASLALPPGQRAFTPWDVRALGLGFEPDSHWYLQAVKLVNRVCRMIEEMEGASGPEAEAADQTGAMSPSALRA